MRLIANNLSKIYRPRLMLPWSKEHVALKNINFAVDEGESLAIVGAAGSGKSTLANILAGVEGASTGQLVLDGKAIDPGADKECRKTIRMVFQDPNESLNKQLTIGNMLDDVLAMNTDLKPAERQVKIYEILAEVGLLREHAEFYPDMLSSGQKHRVALARALILDPLVLIADESLSAVDVSVRAQLVNLLLRLQKERQLTYVMVSHDVGMIKHTCDKVMVLKNGQLEEIGETEQMLTKPKSDYTRRLLLA